MSRQAAALVAAGTVVVMAGSGVAPALPGIARALGPDAAAWGLEGGLAARLVLTTPALAVVLAAPLAGWWARRDARAGLLVGLALVALAGSCGTWVGSLLGLLGARAALGVGMALVMTSSTSLVADLDDGRWIGLQGCGMELGGLLYGIGGGLLAELGWRYPFAIFLLAVPLGLWVVREAPPTPPPLAASARGSASPRAARLDRGAVALACGLAFWAMVLLNLVLVQGPFHLEAALGVGPAAVGLALGVKTLGSAAAGFGFGAALARLGSARLFALAFGGLGLGLLGLAWPTTYLGAVLCAGVAGLGFGFVMPAAVGLLAQAHPAEARPAAMACLTAAAFSGQFVSPLLAHPLAATVGVAGVFFVAALTCLPVSLSGLLAGRRTRRKLAQVRAEAQVEADALLRIDQ